MTQPTLGPGSRLAPTQWHAWYYYSFVDYRSHREACRLAGMSRRKARDTHRVVRMMLALERKVTGRDLHKDGRL